MIQQAVRGVLQTLKEDLTMLFIIWCISIMVTSIINGFVLNVLWRWFVVSKFRLPELGIVCAIGITLIVGMLTLQRIEHEGEDIKDKVVKGFLFNSYLPIICLLIGWITHLFL